jgi:8-oxo-dGTP pyrophosphatase MutT (NUDIX family)
MAKRKAKVLFYNISQDKIYMLLGKRIVSASEEFWWIPGGSAEGGEGLFEAALRELNEEIFITASIEESLKSFHKSSLPLFIRYDTGNSEVTVFIFPVKERDEVKPKEEFVELNWFDISSLPSNMSREFIHIKPFLKPELLLIQTGVRYE